MRKTLLIAGFGALALTGGVLALRSLPTGNQPQQATAEHDDAHGQLCCPHGAHSCSFALPLGIAQCIDQAALTARVTIEQHREDGHLLLIDARVHEVLAGQHADRQLTIVTTLGDEAHDPIPVDAHLLLTLQPAAGTILEGHPAPDQVGHYVISAALNGAVWIDEPECHGYLETARLLARTSSKRNSETASRERAEALANAVSTGGSITRYRAALDMRASQSVVDALTAPQLSSISAGLKSWPALDPTAEPVLEVLASRRDPALVPAILLPLSSDSTLRHFETLGRVLSFPELRDTAGHGIVDLLNADLQPLNRRLAAYVLARIGGQVAQTACANLLADQQQDVASEAIIGLAGSGNLTAREAAYTAVRAALQTEPLELENTPIANVLRGREIQKVRTELHTGDRFRLLAAGYHLARSPELRDREWLRVRLPYLTDWTAAEFLRTRLEGPWMTYDTPW